MIVFILILATALRFFGLGATPAGLHVDEASIGYNAYSILKTGRDEYGKSFPLLIKSFGDYKAPVYTYLLVPVYKVWGMNMATTRSVSAVAGVATIFFLYLLIKLATGQKRLALLGSLVLTISPWHILTSRAAVEANVALMFLIISLWAFFKYLKGTKYFLILAAATAALAFSTYHSERLILPLLYLGLAWQHRKKIFTKIDSKWLTGGVVIALLLFVPTLLILGTPAFFARAKNVSVLGAVAGQNWLSLYTTYFSPKYLFELGDSILRNTYPDVGPFLLWMLPFLLAGAVLFIRQKPSEWKTLIVLLLILSPLPASLVHEQFGTIRALPLTIPMSILIAMGIDAFIEKWKFRASLAVVVLVLLGLGRIYLSAFKLNDFYRYQYWDYGTDKVVEEISKLPDQKVQVDGWRSEIYSQLLFFLEYDPAKYQADNKMANLTDYYNGGAIGQVKKIGRISVKTINWNEDINEEKLSVGSYVNIGDDQIQKYCLTKVFTVRAPDNSILYIGARTNPELLSTQKDCRKVNK